MGISARQFLDSLSRNQILPSAELSTIRDKLGPGEQDADAEKVARELIRQGKLTKFQVANIYHGRGKGLVFGEYVVVDKIGAGGMGHVFKARHRRMKRLVALKVLPPHLTTSKKSVRRFYQEVEVAARLTHPNIVTAYDAGEDHGLHYLAMELVAGEDLATTLARQGRLAVEQVVNVALQAARGLAYAHSQGVVHRDIKPGNLLVDRQGMVKILDLGLARLENPLADPDARERELTEGGQVMGTVDYMAPEQAADTRTADHRADIYGLGSTLYKLLTGEPPYAGETVILKILAHRDRPIPSLRAARPDVPEVLDTLFQKMMAKRPEDRLQPMTAVVAAFERLNAAADEKSSSIFVGEEHLLDGTDDWQDFVSAVSGPGHSLIRRAARHPSSQAAEAPAKQSDPVEKVSPPPLPAKVRAVPPLALAAAGGGLALLLVGALIWFFTHGAPSEPVEQVAGVSDGSTPHITRDQSPQLSTKESPDLQSPDPAPMPATKPSPTTAIVPDQITSAPRVDTPAATALNSADKKSQPPPATPAADEPKPSPPPAQPSSPSKPVARTPKTLIVGTQPDQVKDLNTAFQRTAPGDTILIRHRGPLEFDPIDLTGKMPLTIQGDSIDGVDFWPIVRQAVVPKDKSVGEPLPGILYGERFNLTLCKIHLAVAGPNRVPCSSVFAFQSGRLELKQCSVTAAVQGESNQATALLPLVIARGGVEDRVEVKLDQSYLRGGALGSCAAATAAGYVNIVASGILWAGAPEPWLNFSNQRGPLTATLSDSTIYNAGGLLRWQSEDSAGAPTAAAIRCERSLLVGPYPGQELLVQWNPDGSSMGLSAAVSSGAFTWQGDASVSHRYAGYYREGTKASDLAAWKKLWGRKEVTFHRESDPMFRIWPDGHLLDVTSAWDLVPRFGRNPIKTRQVAERIGADLERLPVAPPAVHSRPKSPSELADKPRGTPRILRVHQRDGPYKTLEAAFAAVREDEIIEVADNGPYTPRRNFTVSPAEAVLVVPGDYITLRAAEGAQPVIVLAEGVHQGSLPVDYKQDPILHLLDCIGRRFFEVDGLHFRVPGASRVLRTVCFHQESDWYRYTNCTFIAIHSGSVSDEISNVDVDVHSAHAFLRRCWLENNIYIATNVPATFFALRTHGTNISDFSMRNCLVDGTKENLSVRGGEMTVILRLSKNSVFGELGKLAKLQALSVNAMDNLFLSPKAMLTLADSDALRTTAHQGGQNAVWAGTRPLTPQEREAGVNALFAGPLLQAPPVSDGPGSSRDPLRKYRLKKGQPAYVMARDGGPVGVRFEYLPTLPTEP